MIRVEIDDDSMVAALARLATGLADMSPVYKEIGEYLVRSTKERFNTLEGPDGIPWLPNAPVTLARKTSAKPLTQDKTLSEQIGLEYGPDFVEVGSNMDYAAMMQFGGTRAAFPHLWGDIPARPFFGLSGEDETAITDAINDYLAELANG